MKKLFTSMCILCIAWSCQKEYSIDDGDGQNTILVCHKEAENRFTSIQVPPSTLRIHLAHGDVIPDEDKDGFSKVNPCGFGTQNDCDDTDPKINPSSKEICDNKKDDNCNGKIDEDCIATVKICNQTWMVLNLDVTNFRDGTPIPQIIDPIEWVNASTPGWCYYEMNTNYGTQYGKLYNWFAVNGDIDGDGDKDKEIAPVGWHVPTEAEWDVLANCLGGRDIAGGALKMAGTSIWASPNTGATNSSGFTGLPGGSRSIDGSFSFKNIGKYGFWWSATQKTPTRAAMRIMEFQTAILTAVDDDTNFGFSVRLIKD